MLFTHKSIDVDNIDIITDELRKFALPATKGRPSGLWKLDMQKFKIFCPNCVKYFKSINQYDNLYKVTIVIVHPPRTGKDAHVDNAIFPPQEVGESKGCLSFNFNVENCTTDETEVYLYKYISGETTILGLPDSVEGSYMFFKDCEMEEIGKYTLKTPVLMNNTVPHAIKNDTDTPRVSVSFRFLVDPWEWAVNGI